MKLPINEQEPYLSGYKEKYTLDEYIDLCKEATLEESAYHQITPAMRHELRYALQNISERNKSIKKYL